MYNGSMHNKKIKHNKAHNQEHLLYKIGGIFLIILSIVLGCYYYTHSPMYQTKKQDTEPAVRGVTTVVDTVPSVTHHDTLTIRIPDGVSLILEDGLGRKSGYVPSTKGFLNDIPFSEVIRGADGSKSIVVSEALAAKYSIMVSGLPRQEALSVEIDNAQTGVQTELLPLNTLSSVGSRYVVTLSPLMIESSPPQNVQ